MISVIKNLKMTLKIGDTYPLVNIYLNITIRVTDPNGTDIKPALKMNKMKRDILSLPKEVVLKVRSSATSTDVNVTLKLVVVSITPTALVDTIFKI